MALPWPSDLCAGTVVWRLAGMKADDHDPDRDPQLIAGEGIEVTFSPDVSSIVGYNGVEGKMSIMPFISSGVIDSQGYLCTKQFDGSAGDRGVVLPATDCETITPRDWTYTVTITDNRVRVDRFSVQVVSDETVDLFDFVKVGASVGTKIISEVQTAERAEAARDEALTILGETFMDLEIRNGIMYGRNHAGDEVNLGNVIGPQGEKGDKGDQGDLPIVVSTTPPADTEVIWINPDEPAGTSSDWALRAEAAAATLGDVGGLHVDTSVGTCVFVGDTMIFYDSGERDITSLVPNRISGNLHLHRQNDTVWLNFRNLICEDQASAWQSWDLLPDGFRPPRSWFYGNLANTASTDTMGPVRISASGQVLVYDAQGQRRMVGTIGFPTVNAPPATLLGTPA